MVSVKNAIIEAKKLTLQLKANEDKYVTGQYDLYETLKETDLLFNQVLDESENEPVPANKVFQDSNLMKLQSRLAKQSAKCYKPDSLVFNPTEFSEKLKLCYGQASSSRNGPESSKKMDELLWLKMGEFAKKLLYAVPPFNFIHGTFDPDPVETVKKKRKMREKDKVGKETKPHSVNLNEGTNAQDMMINEAERLLSILYKLCRKSEDNIICYFEFVTDPTSFSRTVENIFIVSLLVKEGCVRMVKDGNGLPCLSLVDENDKKSRNPSAVKQCIISLSLEEWQDIIKTFKFKKPLIPPRKTVRQDEEDL